MLRNTRYITVIFTLLLALGAAGSHAMWMRVSDKELYDSSAVVAVGTLVEQLQLQPSATGPAITVGLLRLDEAFKGGASASGHVLLRLPPAGGPRSSSDISYKVGQQGLWFLAPVNGSDLYHANHPQRMLPLEQAQAWLDKLRDGGV